MSSGRVPAGLAVFRLSGERTRFAIETIAGAVPPARTLRRAVLRDSDGIAVDSGLCCFFPNPNSFTGEDCAEFHVHGSLAVVRKLTDVLSGISGVRLAEPGEFTKRAFLNGKLDLAEAEGLADLIAAETESQRRLALAQADGALSKVYNEWRERLILCRAMVEAAIDFSEEDDVAEDALQSALGEINNIHSELVSWINRSRHSEIVTEGFRVVIIGPPNAGKSSLLNVLAGREVAIISEEPGTTRDLIEVRLELDGNLVVLTDTAGIRTGAGTVEAIGIEKALGRARNADLVVLLDDASSAVRSDIGLVQVPTIRVGNKSDIGVLNPDYYDVLISVKAGHGLEMLTAALGAAAKAVVGSENLVTMQRRQTDLLMKCVVSLDGCRESSRDVEMIAEHLRAATDCIGRLTGRVDVEELLDAIFSRFCIGK
jgi:tRNA modification GTPase